jgi:hypothetical protein
MTSDRTVDPSVLLALADELESRVAGVADRVSIAIETDLDEAFCIGTRSGYVRLAAALLRAAASRSAPQATAGVSCQWSTFTHEVADRLAQVVVGAECIVETDEQRAQLGAHFRRMAGDEG